MSSAPAHTVSAPSPPEPPPPHRFPVVASLAPMAMSLVLFAVTRSPYTLAFAALGPVVAVASAVDGAMQRKRVVRRESARFTADVARVRGEIDAAHRVQLQDSPPGLAELFAAPASIVTRWRTTDDRVIRVGRGPLPSALRYEPGAAPRTRTDHGVEEVLSALSIRAGRIDDAPITLQIEVGIGVSGPTVARAALIRALVLELATRLAPAEWGLLLPAAHEGWLESLPHVVDETAESGQLQFVSESRTVRIAFAEELPRALDALVDVSADGWAGVGVLRFLPALVSREEATTAATALRQLARGAGLGGRARSSLPEALALAELESVPGTERTLAASVGVSASGPVSFDLVADGPHAIVGGMTGSGKSELLLTWVLGMAATRSPAALSFLFVDFKGGSSFGALLALPHSVGVITDLDAVQALRAIESLSAELRRRERMLADSGLRAIDDADGLPFARLVVVVDEYAALVETFPTLHPVFADLAARGRSLGVHLVLCTQRPTGVVRDAILANCALRISLRVTSAADSLAILGSGDAANLPARPPGRALVSAGGAPPTPIQVAHSDRDDIERVITRWSNADRPHSPWLPPLPEVVTPDLIRTEPRAGELTFALADLPAEQAQRPAAYRPREDGSLLVIGASASGKSGTLAAVAAAVSDFEVASAPIDLPALWDFCVDAVTDASGPALHRPRLVLLDDIDAVLARCPEPYLAALIEMLARLLRDGPSNGIWCVLAAQRLSGALHGLVPLCGSRLLLRMPDRAEHTLAGGEPGDFASDLRPGAGFWRGHRVQIVSAPAASTHTTRPRLVRVDPRVAKLAVVSNGPDRIVAALSALAPDRRLVTLAPVGFGNRQDELSVVTGDGAAILIGDPDVWQSQWSLFGGLQRRVDVLFDGCSLAEVRALTRSRDLPPPFATGERSLWLRTSEGQLCRAALS